MKAIIEGKLYNTETADKVYNYLKNETHPLLWSKEFASNCWREVDIYKTKKGQYFLHIHKGAKDGSFSNLPERIELVDEDDVKEVIAELNPDKYAELFGQVEEG